MTRIDAAFIIVLIILIAAIGWAMATFKQHKVAAPIVIVASFLLMAAVIGARIKSKETSENLKFSELL